MRVSTTLEQIQDIQQTNQQLFLNEKEKKEIYQNYISFLKNEIKDEINVIFLKYKNNYNYDNIYNYILINKNDIIKKIEKKAINESKKHYKIVIDDSDRWDIVDKKKYLWDDFNIINNIENCFFKILKEEKNKDLQEEQATHSILLNELYQVFYNYLLKNKNNNINDVTTYLINNKNYIINNITNNSNNKKYLSLNFSKILKKAINDNKIYYKFNNINDNFKNSNNEISKIKILLIISIIFFIFGYFLAKF